MKSIGQKLAVIAILILVAVGIIWYKVHAHSDVRSLMYRLEDNLKVACGGDPRFENENLIPSLTYTHIVFVANGEISVEFYTGQDTMASEMKLPRFTQLSFDGRQMKSVAFELADFLPGTVELGGEGVGTIKVHMDSCSSIHVGKR